MLPRLPRSPFLLSCVTLLLVAAVGVPLCGPAHAQSSRENADFKLALGLYNDGYFDLAAEQFRQFVQTYPAASQGVEARYYLGLCQLKLGRTGEARVTFQTLALTYPEHPRAAESWWRAGEALAAEGNDREAALAFERVKVFHPKSPQAPDALVRSAGHFLRAGDPGSARRVLRTVLQEYPSSRAVPAARTQLGRMLFQEGNLAQAQAELARVVEGDPSPEARSEALLLMGDIALATARPAVAREQYEEIVRKYPETPAGATAVVNLGKALAATGNPKAAAQRFEEALPSNPADDRSRPDTLLVQEALKGLAACRTASGAHGEAVKTYDRFLRSFPGNPETPAVLWRMAKASARAGDWNRSTEACQRLLELPEGSLLRRKAHLRIAANAVRQKQYQQAVAAYMQFIDQAADDPAAGRVVMTMAGIQERDLGDHRRAAATYDLLATRAPSSPTVDDALAGAARCAESGKDPSEALERHSELIRRYPLSPHRPAAEERIRTIRLFEARDKEAGMEKLAALLGDVVTDSARTGLAFRLGEIYFREMKNYAAAAAQFSTVVNSGLKDPRFVDAFYLRGKCYEYLAWGDEGYRTQAVDAARSFMSIYRSDPRGQDAALSLFLLSARDPATAEQAAGEVRAAYPAFARQDTLLLRSGVLQEAAGNTAAAAEAYAAILARHASSPSADEAMARAALMRAGAAPADSFLAWCDAYLARFPTGRFAEQVSRLSASGAMAAGRAPLAAERLRRLLQAAPYLDDDDSLSIALAEALVASGEPEQAIGILTGLLAAHSRSSLEDEKREAAILFALGEAHARTGNAAQARSHFFRALELERTGQRAGEAYVRLGSLARKEGNAVLASSYFALAGTAAPGGRIAAPDVAETLFETGEEREAIRQYTILASGNIPSEDRRLYESKIIVAHIRLGELQTAEKLATAFDRKYRGTGNEIALFELERGNLAYRNNDVGKARKSFERVAGKYEDTPSAPTARYWLGKILESEGKPAEALVLYNRIIAETPGAPIVPRAYLGRGNIHYQAGRWDEAARNYRRVVDDPNTDPATMPLAIGNLIETYQAAGLHDAALSLTRRYLEEYPDAPDALDKRITIGVLYQRLGEYDRSVEHLEDLLERAGGDLEGELRYYIAEANYGKGDYQQAILDFLKVPYLVTKKGKLDWTANSLYMAGKSYEKLGNPDRAVAMYQQIVDRSGIDPTFKEAARKEIARVKSAGAKPATKP